MTRDDIVREMAQAEQHAEAALVALAAAYQQRGDLLWCVAPTTAPVRSAHLTWRTESSRKTASRGVW